MAPDGQISADGAARRHADDAHRIRRIGKADDVVVTELRLMARVIAFKTMLKRPIRMYKEKEIAPRDPHAGARRHPPGVYDRTRPQS